MKTITCVSSAMILATALALPRAASAMQVPDTGTLNSVNPGLWVTNTSVGAGLYGQNDSFGIGVAGRAKYGLAVWGFTNTGTGVHGEAIEAGGRGGQFKTQSNDASSIALRAEAPTGATALVAYNPDGTAAWLQGNVYYTGSLSHWSDARLKKDVRDLAYGLNEVMRLRPVTFEWKREGARGRHLGFIAQEVDRVTPEVVSIARDSAGPEVMTVDYIALVPLLTKALQQQNGAISRQEERLASLEKRAAPTTTASFFGGSAFLGLLPFGLFLAKGRRRTRIG